VAETAVVTLLVDIRLVAIAAGVALTVRTIPAAGSIPTCQYKSTHSMRWESEDEKYGNTRLNHTAHQCRTDNMPKRPQPL
jgi:hypothetical protein